MTARAEVRTEVTGTDVGVRKLSDLEAGMQRLAATTQKTSTHLKQARELWNDPSGAKGKWDWTERMGVSVAKASIDIIKGQVGAAADAVVAPARTSYAGAIAVANQYRDTTQRIATSTGAQYAEIGKQVTGASQRLGLLPGQVQNYSRGVRSLTGDWKGAMSGLEGYQNRALATDRTIEEMIPTAAHLAQTFGIKSTQDVNKFFGTIDAQAKSANVSTQVLEQTVLGISSSFARLTSAGPAAISGLSAQVMGGAPTREMGEERLGHAASFLQAHDTFFEARARGMGKIKKGESFFDSEGRVKADQFPAYIETAQQEIARHYGVKNTGPASQMELARRMRRSGEAPSLSAALGFLRINPNGLGKAAGPVSTDSTALADFMASDAGKRTQSDAQKQIRDIGLGTGMLGAQDTAVGMGGGAAGVALASAGQIFEKSTGVFWDAVNIFAGTAGGKAASGTVARVAGGVASSLASPAMLAASALTLQGDTRMPDDVATANEISSIQSRLKRRGPNSSGGNRGSIFDFTGWDSTESLQGKLASLQGRGDTATGSAQADAIGASVVKHLGSVTLRTQSVTPPPAGVSQPQ